MRRRDRGITLTEILLVIAIVGLLCALLFPVYQKAKKAATITKSISNMRQLHQAIYLYMGDDLSPVANHGLPIDFIALKQVLELPKDIFHTGGSNYYAQSGTDVYAYMAQAIMPISERNFSEHVQKTNGNPILIVDGTQNTNVNFDIDRFELRLGIGIYFDGHVERRHHTGSSNRLTVWE